MSKFDRDLLVSEVKEMLRQHGNSESIIIPPNIEPFTFVLLKWLFDDLPPDVAREFGDRMVAVSNEAETTIGLSAESDEVQHYFDNRSALVTEMVGTGLIDFRTASLALGNFGMRLRHAIADREEVKDLSTEKN